MEDRLWMVEQKHGGQAVDGRAETWRTGCGWYNRNMVDRLWMVEQKHGGQAVDGITETWRTG